MKGPRGIQSSAVLPTINMANGHSVRKLRYSESSYRWICTVALRLRQRMLMRVLFQAFGKFLSIGAIASNRKL